MNQQEIFNTVVQHLRAQGKQAMGQTLRKGDMCMYLAPDGCKCAAGCLIPPEDYRPEFEGNSIENRESAVGVYFKQKFPNSDDRELIQDLQNIHDNGEVNTWESQWRYLASNYGLDMPERVLT